MEYNDPVSYKRKVTNESASKMAEAHQQMKQGSKIRPVKPILDSSRETLTNAYRILSGLAKSAQELSPAAEWIIDNFYIIQEQIVEIQTDFPKAFQRSIPISGSVEYGGLPRVYELIKNYLVHTDLLVNSNELVEYIEAYQQKKILMQGEIWAIPIMLRLVLIEKLAEKSSSVLKRKKLKLDVVKQLKKIEAEKGDEPGALIAAISDWVKQNSYEINEQLILIEWYNQLQSTGRLEEGEKRWFNYKFKQFDLPVDELIRIEAQKESRLHLSVQNAVESLRKTSENDWGEFVEECSVIEKILRLDPSGYYEKMDFQTRNRYRGVIERLSRRSQKTETEVTEELLLLIEQHMDQSPEVELDPLREEKWSRQHVGFYLLGDGYIELAERVGYSMPLKEKIRRMFEQNNSGYISAIILLNIILMVILWLITDSMSRSAFISAMVLAISLFPALELSISAINRFFAFWIPPRILPKMDYKSGIPANSRTVVVVPTLFTSPEDVKNQIEKIEIRSLASNDRSLQFGFLSDFADASKQEMEGDSKILQTARSEIRRLNRKYQSKYGDRFFMLHRQRVWNPSEDVWMGWERKRGKIEQFNELLMGESGEQHFDEIEGDIQKSIRGQPVQFVITLDADTKLHPESAQDLIRTISHPLNRAFYCPEKKRVVHGYGIIQPRISILPNSARRTWFSRIFSGNVGLDPYSTAVSDIYQDIAGEAIFTGKGIYDVRAFHTVLHNRFPDNRILSHDLIESTYLRAGLATDIELFDDYPTTYLSFSRRNHRWIRGDWQIAAWLFGRVPERSGKEPNRINLLSKWKIFDNLRRSLNPLFLTVFFIAGWFWLPGSPWIWTAAGFGILAFPIYVSLSSDILNRPARVRWKLYLEKVISNLKINSVQTLFTIIILPHQAVVQLDAVIRTLYRIHVSEKHLLEWTTASHTESSSPNSISAYTRSNIISIILGIGVVLTAVFTTPAWLWVVLPFAVAWTGAPFYLWYISRPVTEKRDSFTKQDRMKLRSYARRTWFYYERFVNAENSWLPPDNYQEDPPLSVTQRTSPTNIGLALVSTQVAYNRGYLTFSDFLYRSQKMVHSLQQLEQFRGHFYNWYDTRLGEVLNPQYISTVDSGNLAAGLIVLKESVRETMKQKGIQKNIWQGLVDTLTTVKEVFKPYSDSSFMPYECYKSIQGGCSAMLKELEEFEAETHMESFQMLKKLKKSSSELCSIDLMPLGGQLSDSMMQDLLFWVESPLKLVESAIEELKNLPDSYNGDLHSFSPAELAEIYRDTEQPKRSSTKVFTKWMDQANDIIDICEKMIQEMDFTFLYLNDRKLFSIGYNVEKASLDTGSYDLLASEARIASYIAIAKGDVSVEHWFRLSRRLTSLNRNEILLSWGGTMFEYLMPVLFMRTYDDTLINHTCNNVIDWQVAYGRKNSRPWGSSESAYSFMNIDMHYQYRTFGVPGLGLKRGLAEEYVIAPYASMLSLMVKPVISLQNLKEIESIGGYGIQGFYDALDFTPSRLEKDKSFEVVKTYMVHHHGMSLLAIENVLNDWAIHKYFHADLRVQACELILQEKIPRGVPIKEPHPIDAELEPGEKTSVELVVEHAGMSELDRSPPRLHLLSNGSYSLFLTHAGTGRSKKDQISMYGWEPDPTSDPLGLFFYIKDVESGTFWSSMHQPVKRKPDRYDTWFHDGKIVTSRVDEWIETTTTVSVSPDHPVEVRKITLTNYSQNIRELELTSYAEAVLNREIDHQSHPAFSKLFLQTDFLPEHNAILVRRRPRAGDESAIWMVHTFAEDSGLEQSEPVQFETERVRFTGRGRSLHDPKAMMAENRLSGSLGNVTDPIMSIRKTLTLKPGEKKEFTFGIGFAENREFAEQLADTFDNRYAADRAFDLASVYSSVELDHIGVTSKKAHYFQKLASPLIYPEISSRADERTIRKNRKKQHDLWVHGISGDLPLIIYRIDNVDQLKDVKKLLNAVSFWRLKGLETELLFLNDHSPSYVDEVQESIIQEVERSGQRDRLHNAGGIFIHRTDKMSAEDLNLLLTVAEAVYENSLPDFDASYLEQIETSWYTKGDSDIYTPAIPDGDQPEMEKESLQFFNGFGGFNDNGNEYHILINTDPGSKKLILPPAPWVNVIANPDFGFLATERGSGYTWSKNSRENKLTSWSNDPVEDSHSEVFYVRDEDAKTFWSPTPGPVPGNGNYRVIHGFGYTEYHHQSGELEQKVRQYVDIQNPVKVSVLTVSNKSDRDRELSLFRYTDRVLGVHKRTSGKHIVQQSSSNGRYLIAENFYNNEFAGRAAFSGISELPDGFELSYTTDRKSFIGRNRSLDRPMALSGKNLLDNRIEVNGDPCAAFQVKGQIKAGESVRIVLIDGETDNLDQAEEHIKMCAKDGWTEKTFNEAVHFWKEKLGRVTVKTPDPSLNLLMNGWLSYQNISCRMWGRTAFYQAGGAYGFRDQLQDAMAALYVDSELTRKQILRHSANQFPEGDVLHWWHPPTGRGIRSKITDDRLWLPYVTNFYVQSTGDTSILDEEVNYIEARKLEDHEHEVYLQPEISDSTGSVYDHCCRAIDISLKFGVNGLPLIGAGDWNDGLNQVGVEGRGESVWLGFFLCKVLDQFERICRSRGDSDRADRYRSESKKLKNHLNREGWDGNWYLRAFYDDGTPMGSHKNKECRIDGISQSWSVISQVADKERGAQVMREVENQLIDKKAGIIKLLTPPFDRTEKNPGYIKGYIPGVRENGGQYTHAACWVIKAMAESGTGTLAHEYFHMINPINHSLTKDDARRYRVEPYVVAADIYGESPLDGMGGWSWYTGSGGWYYRVALESILGFRLHENSLSVRPSASKAWKEYVISYRLDDGITSYEIVVENPHGYENGILKGTLDGETLNVQEGRIVIPIKRDRSNHHVRITIEKSSKTLYENSGE